MRGHSGRHLRLLKGLYIGATDRVSLTICAGRNIQPLVAQARCTRMNGGSHHRGHRRLGRRSPHGGLRRDAGGHSARTPG